MSEPFYKNGNMSVFCGDSLKILDEFISEGRHFDLLLTDTPYGLNQKNSKTSGINAKRAKASYDGDFF